MPELEIKGGEWDVYRILSIMYYPDPGSEKTRELYAHENHGLRRTQFLKVTSADYVFEVRGETGQEFPISDKEIHTLVYAPSAQELKGQRTRRGRDPESFRKSISVTAS